MPKVKEKILMVEDDPSQAMMYEVAFENAGYKIFIAPSGKTGLELVEKESPRLVFLDMLLGDMSGMDVLKQLKANDKTKDIKVVILSNLNKTELKVEAKNAGALDFLLKMQLVPKDVIELTKGYLKN